MVYLEIVILYLVNILTSVADLNPLNVGLLFASSKYTTQLSSLV